MLQQIKTNVPEIENITEDTVYALVAQDKQIEELLQHDEPSFFQDIIEFPEYDSPISPRSPREEKSQDESAKATPSQSDEESRDQDKEEEEEASKEDEEPEKAPPKSPSKQSGALFSEVKGIRTRSNYADISFPDTKNASFWMDRVHKKV